MHVIGVVGGIAGGKSTVSRQLQQLGARSLDADAAGHAVLDEPEVIELLQNRWGIDVMSPEQRIDRQAVAARVFGDVPNAAEERRFLESVTHPRIRRRLEAEIDEARRAGAPAVVLDVPLLLEVGWETICDSVLFVDTPREQRLARVAERGWTSEELDQREQSQWPLERKKSLADIVIDNSSEPQQTQQQLQTFWRDRVQDAVVDGA